MPNRRRKCRPRAAPAGEVVYFVRAGDAIKIGRTAHLGARLRALATASAVPLELLAVVPGGRQLEARLHRRWRHLRLRGEWFRADEALVRHARGQATGPAPPTPAEAARAADLRRVLAVLVPADLAAAGLC
jgi:Meiotically up-regulated gene 113